MRKGGRQEGRTPKAVSTMLLLPPPPPSPAPTPQQGVRALPSRVDVGVGEITAKIRWRSTQTNGDLKVENSIWRAPRPAPPRPAPLRLPLLPRHHHSLRNVETRIIGGITESGIVARETKWRETRYTHARVPTARRPPKTRFRGIGVVGTADDHCSRA